MRGTKVGDVVAIAPIAGREIVGTITSVDSQGVRTLVTAAGHYHAVPDEMTASDEPDRTKVIEEIEPGDVVVLFNGTRRTVEHNVPFGSPPRHRLVFVEQDDKPLSVFRNAIALHGTRFYVVPPEAAEDAQH